MRAAFLLVLAAWWPASAVAQTAPPPRVVISAGPDKVSVTLYRDPDRGADTAIDRNRPTGFALITETRTVTIPAGAAVIRFEGVAGNILPESALVSGLPDGVEEKNLDASLLSPRSLYDRALGRRVMVKRTDPATGKVRTEQAVIRSGPDGVAVLQIGKDFTDYKCTGLPEKLVYDGVPEGLSAKPTLSVRTTSRSERKVTLTLAYLAGGFDWQADYIVSMLPDGRSADMFAWITLASSDVTSFANAELQVVAGRLNRENGNPPVRSETDYLALKCWPLPYYDLYVRPPAPPAPEPVATMEAFDVVVTANRSRAVMAPPPAPAPPPPPIAQAEQLGDLKLYRFPVRVTVASQGQKQVAMLSKPAVKLSPVYKATIYGWQAMTWLVLRGKNVDDQGLGVALPAGKASVFSKAGDQSLLVAESSIADKAKGEEVEFELGMTPVVKTSVLTTRGTDKAVTYELVVTNANPWPVDYEGEIYLPGAKPPPDVTLGKRNGAALWTTTVPANGTARLRLVARPPGSID